MSRRMSFVACVVIGVAPALAAAQPTRFQLEATLSPGERASLAIGAVPSGQFAFAVRGSGVGDIRFGITQQRGVAPRFAVVKVPSPFAATACQTSAGSVLCRGITTPAPVAGSTYTFRVRNTGTATLRVLLAIRWSPARGG